jgi:hypothetical protein
MWQTFVPDLVVAFIGATLTVLIAFMTYLLRLRLEEKRALQSLINELHRRRALVPGSKPLIPDAELTDDYKRANASVLSIRDEIRRTRDLVRQVDSRQLPLSNMTRACNRYLEFSAVSPSTYAILLGELQRELSEGVRVLAQARPDVVALEPGAGAL